VGFRFLCTLLHDLNSGSDTTAFQAVNFKLVLFYTSITRLTVTVKVSPADPDGLRRTLQTANGACDWISEQAWHHKTFRQLALHKLVYYQVRQRFGLSAQMAVRGIAKVVDAYALDKRTKRDVPNRWGFPYDARILSWDLESETVSLWTVAGRRRMPFECGERQRTLLERQQGESDLIYRRQAFYLATTSNVDVPEPQAVDEFLGVDLGVANLANDSDGRRYCGSEVKNVRWRNRKLRARLQARQTRSAKRRLKKLAGRESRFARHAEKENTGRSTVTQCPSLATAERKPKDCSTCQTSSGEGDHHLAVASAPTSFALGQTRAHRK
jgi:predicted transposase